MSSVCRKASLSLVSAALCLPWPGTSWAQVPRKVTAFVHVNVVPMDREAVLVDHTVIVVGDRIQALGPSHEVQVPAEASIIAGDGKYLMPGLADMHTHLWYEGDLLVYVANGVTTIRSLFGGSTHLEWREQIKRGERLGPTIVTTGPILDGEPPRWSESTVVTTPEEAAAAVLDQRRAGYDGVKVYHNLLPEVYNAILVAAEQHGLPVYGHIPIRVGLRRALSGGQRSFEHVFGLVWALLPDDSPVRANLIAGVEGKVTEGRSELFWVTPYEHADETRIQGLVSQVVASGVWICPTLVVAQRAAFDSSEAEAYWANPSMAYVAPEVRSFWKEREEGFRAEEVDVAAMKRGVQLEFRLVRALHQAGARMVLGTDAPNPFVFPGSSVHDELQNLVDAGFSPYEALRAATADVPLLLGAAEEMGKIATGMRADLLLLDSNPLDDIKATRSRTGVMVRGQWHSDRDLATQLAELAARYREEEAENRRPL